MSIPTDRPPAGGFTKHVHRWQLEFSARSFLSIFSLISTSFPFSPLLKNAETVPGLEFSHLYRLCRERFLVGNEMALRSHLIEFSDHQMISTRYVANEITVTCQWLLFTFYKLWTGKLANLCVHVQLLFHLSFPPGRARVFGFVVLDGGGRTGTCVCSVLCVWMHQYGQMRVRCGQLYHVRSGQ